MLEDAFRNLGALDGSLNALLRRQRLRRETASATPARHSDFMASGTDQLLKRMSEEGGEEYDQHSKFSEEPKPNPPWAPSHTKAESTAPTSESPDLWSLLQAEASDAPLDRVTRAAEQPMLGEHDTDDATPGTRLREYLSRPERLGRRPITLDGDDVPESAGSEVGRGRRTKGRRRS